MKSALAERSCPRVEAAFSLLSRKWTGLIIRALIARPLHFCELEKSLPALSARVLALRMRELEDSGIVHPGGDRLLSAEGALRAHREGKGSRARDRGHRRLGDEVGIARCPLRSSRWDGLESFFAKIDLYGMIMNAGKSRIIPR